MKGFNRFIQLSAWLLITLPLPVAAQNTDSLPNYVVIGAFAQHQNAVHFTEDANKNNFPARFEINPSRNLYYVYVMTTFNRAQAVTEALRLRAETKYFDTWVYGGLLGSKAVAVKKEAQGIDLNPATGQPMSIVKSEQESGAERKIPAADHRDLADPAAVHQASVVAKATAEPGHPTSSVEEKATGEESEVVPRRVSTEPLASAELAGKNFYFHLFRADNHETVEGEIDAIDIEKSRKMATYAANTSVKVQMPSGKSKHLAFVCQVFGYRKQQREFDPANPAEDLYLDENGNLVVPFELVRLQKGDIAIMYNVFFFKDAAVMRPESRYEVNNLLDLLNENPSYKIRIHGHTNGNASGKIIRMNTPGNFYSLSGTKQGFGSAKKLSEERALLMREFLIASGISGDRMQVKAWGGKKPIHDKHSSRANENVRVEIEILSE